MSPKQKKLAAKAPPPNKLDEKDFKVLRAEKAKGRGMGLQDESVQPGKVMKAKRGHFSKSNISGHKRVMGVFPTIDKVPPTAKGKDLLKKNTTPLKALGKVATSRAGALGAILGAGAVGLNIAGKKLKEFAEKKKEKKMGGGMIAPSQRPGYSKGTMVKARGCKLGRTRPTKIT